MLRALRSSCLAAEPHAPVVARVAPRWLSSTSASSGGGTEDGDATAAPAAPSPPPPTSEAKTSSLFSRVLGSSGAAPVVGPADAAGEQPSAAAGAVAAVRRASRPRVTVQRASGRAQRSAGSADAGQRGGSTAGGGPSQFAQPEQMLAPAAADGPPRVFRTRTFEAVRFDGLDATAGGQGRQQQQQQRRKQRAAPQQQQQAGARRSSRRQGAGRAEPQLPPLEQREADLPFAVEHAFALARDPHLTYTDVARMPVMWDEISEREKKKCLAASRPGPRPARTHQGGKLEERVAAALREAAAELAANGTPATEDELAEVAAEAVKEQRAELQRRGQRWNHNVKDDERKLRAIVDEVVADGGQRAVFAQKALAVLLQQPQWRFEQKKRALEFFASHSDHLRARQ